MAHLLTWPKRRALTTGDGLTLVTVVEPGRLRIETPSGAVFDCADAAELRAFAMQVYAASIELDHHAQYPPGQGRAHLKRQRRLAAARQQAPDHADQETA